MAPKGLFLWRRTGPVSRASSSRWDDLYPTFIWNTLSQFNQKVCYVAEKDWSSNFYNSIPPWRAGPLARVHMENFYLAKMGSRQNQYYINIDIINIISILLYQYNQYQHIYTIFPFQVFVTFCLFVWYFSLHLIWEENEAIKKILRLKNMLNICLFF